MRLFNQNENIDSIFKKRFKNYKAEHSDALWEKIQMSLDESSTNTPSKKYFAFNFRSKYLKISAVVAFLIITSSVFLNFNQNNSSMPIAWLNFKTTNPDTDCKDDLVIEKTPLLADNQNTQSKKTEVSNNQNRKPITTSNSKQLSRQNDLIPYLKTKESDPKNTNINISSSKDLKLDMMPITTEENKVRVNDNFQELPSALPLNYLSIVDNDEIVNSIKDKEFLSREVRKISERKLGLKGAYFGIESQFNNTWILTSNLDTKDNAKQVSIDQTKTIHYNLSFTNGFGIRAGYDFSSRIGIEGKVMENKIKQEYTEEKEGNTYFRNTELKYIQVPVYFKYKWARISNLTQQPIVMNYKVGLQYAYLTKAMVNLNNEFIPIKDVMRKHDMGIVAGIDYDIYVNNFTYVSLGTNIYFGSNLKSFPYLVNDANQKTNNLAIGLNASLNFKLNQKSNK